MVDDAEAVDTEDRGEEEDVNFISGTGFQGSGNQSGNRKSYGNRGNSKVLETRVRRTRNPTATTTATTGVMETSTTRSHHRLLKRARLKRCLIWFLRDSSA